MTPDPTNPQPQIGKSEFSSNPADTFKYPFRCVQVDVGPAPEKIRTALAFLRIAYRSLQCMPDIDPKQREALLILFGEPFRILGEAVPLLPEDLR